MRKTLTYLILFTASLFFSSCSKLLEPLYVHLPGTEWVYELNGKRAYIHFDQDGTASVLQKDLETGAVQENNGTYTCDGHNADISCPDGTTFNLIRTFSHLKNSKNRNMTRLSPQMPTTLDKSLWVGVDRGDLYVYYFPSGNEVTRATFIVTGYAEGVPLSWERKTSPITLSSYAVTFDGKTAWLFSEVMLLDKRWHVTFPEPLGSGNESLAGSMWYYSQGTSSSPGIVIFDTGHSFSRVQIYSGTQMTFERGTYTMEGNSITMTLSGKSDNCTISADNTFRFMERTYKRLD